jgi:alcohol dehydrogenase
MKAVVIEAFGESPSIQNVPDPTPDAGGVVIRVEASGICRSDWHGWMGHDPDITLPHVPGHEFAGFIEAIGADVRRWKPRDKVTVPFCVGCGSCPQCKEGLLNLCDNSFQPGFTHWGSFARYVAVKYADTNLVSLPKQVDFTTAASLGCRFVTSHWAVVTRGEVREGEWLAVHGCGGVGLSAIMIAHAMGAKVIGIDIDDAKLILATTLGATAVFNARSGNVVEVIRDVTGGGAHVSIDALGSPKTCRNSIRCLRKRGRHVQVGLMAGEDRHSPLPIYDVISKELHVLGSYGMPAHRLPPVLEMIVAGKLDPTKLVGKTVSLEEAGAELQAMTEFRGTGMSVITEF